MNRRTFHRTLAAGALSAAASGISSAAPVATPAAAPCKLSVMLWTVFGELSFEQRLEKIAAAGYKYVQLVGEYQKWSEEDFRRANAQRRALGIRFDTTAGLAHGIGDPREREAFLADLRKELAVMEKIECPAVIVMSGNRIPSLGAETQHKSCVEGLKRAAEIVEGKGVALWLENIDLEENPHYFLWSIEELFQIVGEVNHPQVRALYDFFHAQISGGNLISLLERNFSKVACVHIADVPGRHEPGTGEINYTNIYKKLAELKFAGSLAMEFIPTGEPVASLRTAREAAERAMAKPGSAGLLPAIVDIAT